MYFYFTMYSGNESLPFFRYYANVRLGLGGMPEGFIDSIGRFPYLNFGHAWFIQHLLVYAVVYWLLRKIFKNCILKQESKPFAVLHILAIFVFIAASSLIARFWFPIDYWVGLLVQSFSNEPTNKNIQNVSRSINCPIKRMGHMARNQAQ